MPDPWHRPEQRLPQRAAKPHAASNVPPTEAALRCGCAAIEKLGNGGDELRWRERLGQKDAVGNAVRTILVGVGAGHINDGKSRVDLSGLLCDFPAAHVAAQIDVGHKRAVFPLVSLEQGHRLFARSGNGRFKTAIAKRFFNDALNRVVVFNDEDNR